MGTVTINGVTYTGNNITIRNNNVIIDGKTQYKNKYNNTVNIDIVGNVQNVNCNGTVSVNGTVIGDIDCGGSCNIDGDVGGSIDCGGSCSAMNIKGNIDAGGSVYCSR